MDNKFAIVIPSRNRPVELAHTIGAFTQHPCVREIVIIDNSDTPYLDTPLFVMLQDAFAREGRDLIFIREVRRHPNVWLRYIGVCRTTMDHVMVWDDDMIPLTPLDTLVSRLGDYGELGFCFLDVINYLGYADWTPEADPDNLGRVIHPYTVMYRWFKSDKYDRFETPWGTGGQYLVNRSRWVKFFEEEGHKLLEGRDPKAIGSDLLMNAAYLNATETVCAFHFCDRAVNYYHPTQPREWDASLFDSIMADIERKFVKGRKARFVGKEAGLVLNLQG